MARGGRFEPLRLVARGGAPEQSVGDPGDWQLITDMLADAHARAKSFGVGSVLQMPFPAAVKTGTSSDFRDTWTVGFTRDYTVGVWVGNFDGSAMRGVSGVTGAGPLWNRIMLHLYERSDEPLPFARPRGFVRTPICATTGHAPSGSSNCPAIVEEWVRPQDLAEVRSPAAPPREQYDSWLALHPRDASGGLRIVSPHDGDVFVRNEAGDAEASREQQIALRAVASGGAVRWSVDGQALPLDAAGTAFWPLRFGTWRIDAVEGTRHDRVTIRVVPPPRPENPGFSLIAPSPR
jgi:penicillin-binding protein 1C